jgi:uncharacterized protein (TIGR00255 family)
MRSILTNVAKRGKVDLGIQLDHNGSVSNHSLNMDLAKKYYEELKTLSGEIGNENFSEFLPIIVRMPDVMKPEKEALGEEEWNALKNTLIKALEGLDEFRTEEGNALEKDFVKRIHIIEELLAKIPSFEGERIELLKNRISKELEEITKANSYDKNRFEQELIYYLEKLDITEEKVRLKKHCSYFSDTMNEKESNGKKLGFISQEIGREINTIGSKANHAEIQKIVVQMKDELEKIKEQLSNIL